MKRFLKTALAVDPASPFPDTETQAQARPLTNSFLPHWPCPSVSSALIRCLVRLSIQVEACWQIARGILAKAIVTARLVGIVSRGSGCRRREEFANPKH